MSQNMRQYLRISRTVFRIPTCVLIFLVVFSCVIRSGQQEIDDPHSFTTLLQVLEGDNVRERRAAEQDDALEGSGPVTPDEDAPVIVVSEQKKFVLKKVGRLSVDVGSTVWAVRGTEIIVSCRASSPSGTPTKIEWLRSYGGPVTERFRGGVAAREGTLTIRKLGRFNEGTYTCRASNRAGNTTALFTAKIIIASLPTILKTEGDFSFGPNDKVAEITIGSDVTVYPGTKLTIRCPVEGTGNILVFWTSRGRPVNIGNAQRVGNDLVITDIDKRYALEYECTARAARGKVSEKSTVRVKDLDPPRIKHGTRDLRFIEEELPEVEIYVGSKLTVISETQITVRCIAAMVPAPAVSWKIQGKDSGFKDDVILSKDNSSLTISDPGVEDSGVYTCTASNNVGRDSESSLINIIPPEPPRIKHSNRKITSLENLDVVEAKIGDELTLLAGANVVITCPTSGLPTPTIKWLKDGEDLSVNGSILTVKNVKTEDSGTFTCEAVNRAGRFSYNSEFRVIAGEKPRIETMKGRIIGLEGIEEAVVKIGQDLRVVEGLIVRLVCAVRGFPTPEVTWFLNDRPVKTSGRFLVDTRSNSLIVDGIQLQDTGQVLCTASNSAGTARASSFISIIGESSAQIQYGNSSIESIKKTAKVAIEIGDRLHVLSGSDVSIDCVARGTPRPVIYWRWNGREVISGSREGQYTIKDIPNGSRLTVWQMLVENAGQYECVAINTGGGDRVASTITILDATSPEIEISTSSVEHIQNLDPVSVVIGTRVKMLPGGRLEITCRASGIPEPSISWLRQNKQITSSGRFSIINTTLIIYPTELDDRGSFTCAANNTLGRQTYSTKVDIIEPIKPRITKTGRDMKVELLVRLSEVVGGNILCRDGIDLELTCPVQGLPTPKITWLRGDKRVGTGGRLKLGILREESSGNYSCVASNIAGEARKTTKLNVKSSIPPVIQSSTKVVESYEEDLYLAVEIGTRLRVIQGAKIDLICRVTGFPTPNVNWVKGNSPLTVSFERQGFIIVPYNGTSSTLLIRGSQPPQEDEVYGCTAYNSGGSVTAFSYVTFKERVPPRVLSTWLSGSVGVQESLETRDPVTVILGDTARMFTRTEVTIVCEVKAIPVAKVTWTKNGGPIRAKHSINGTNLVLSEQSGISESGRYVCTATNPLGRDSAFSDITFIEPVLPTIITGESSVQLLSATNYRATIGSNITTVIGNNITFVCVAEGLPRPDVSWWKGDLDLNVNETSYVVYASDTNATGVYSCEASNLGGTFTTSSAVTVLDRVAPEKATRPRIITNREDQESLGDQRTVQHTVGGNVTILEGRNLLLRCPVEGVPAPSTRWLFDGFPVQLSDTLQVDDDTGDLTIIEMTEDDVGEYSCVATNIAGETVEASYTTVIVPTFPNIDSSNILVRVFDPTRQPVTVKIGSHVITLTGTPVTITCDATGLPEPKVSWMKGFTSITGSDGERLIVGKNRLSLLSSGVSDSDQYMCTASSPGGQAAAVSNITFVESVKPRILFSTKTQEILQRLSLNITIGEKLTILDKSNVTVECSAKGVPPPSLSWSKDGVKLKSLQSNLLHLRNIAREDTGRYTCTAENFLGFVSQSTLLSVRAGRKPFINSKSQGVVVDDKVTDIKLDVGSNLTLVAGSSVTIACEVDAVPEPVITWLQNKNQVLNNVNKSSLTVDNPSRVNLQTVSCTAANILGSDSKSSYFTILEPSKPRIKIHEVPRSIEAQNRSPITLNIGDELTALTETNVTIQCPTSGVPRPTVTWTKDGRILRDDGRYTIQIDGSLVIDEASLEDSARYTCNADSINGQDSASSTVQVVEPIKPVIEVPKYGQDIPLDDVEAVNMNIGDNVTAASNTTITIRCPVSGVPTPSVTWQKNGVQITEGDKFAMTDDNSLVINKAEIEHSAKYSCIVQNEFGKDEAFSTARIIELSKPNIDVADKPHTIEAQDRRPMTFTIGGNVTALTRTIITIQCYASGVPTPTVTWTKDDLRISSGGRYTVEEDGSLLIADSKEGDSAKYRCTATSVAGKDSASSTVQIVEPLKPGIEVPETGRAIPLGDGSPVTMNIGNNVTAASNTTITIKCPVSGVPTPALTWKKDGVQVVQSERINIANADTLVIKEAELIDSAKYTCIVENSFGKDEISSTVKIIEPSKPVIKIPGKPTTTEAQDRNPITLAVGDNVTALTNTSITIQCPTNGVPIPLVTWTKDDQRIPSGGRYTTMSDGSLLIVGSREDDSAKYTCTAISVAGEDSASSTVKIQKPIKPVIEVPEPGRDIPFGNVSAVTLNIGDNVTTASKTTITLRCPFSGVPKPFVTWKKDGVPVVDGGRINFAENNTLVIKQVELDDSAKYTCSVQNWFGKDEASSIVRIIEPSKPVITIPGTPKTIEAQDQSPIALSIGDNVTALTNTSITIRCPIRGVPAPIVTWKKDSEEITNDGRYTVQDDGSLLISEVNEEDSARYTCTAESVTGKDSASSTVQIIESAKPVINVPQYGKHIPIGDGSPVTMNVGDNVTAASNTTITIRCPVSGVPPPSVTWQKDAVEISEGEKLTILDYNTLVIKDADLEDDAKYTCTIQNAFGKDLASSIVRIIEPSKPDIKIPGKPTMIEAQDRSPITLSIGDDVKALTNTSITIQCPTSGVPTPTITWTKDGEKVANDSKYTIQDDGSLLISEAVEEHSARYTCIAESIIGEDSATSEVQIVEPVKPVIEVPKPGRDIPVGDGSPVTMNIGDNVTAASNTTITIRCPVSGVPTPAVTWEKDGVLVLNDDDRFSVREDNSLVITGAEENAEYTCKVSNVAGKDSLTSIINVIGPSKPKVNIPGKPKTTEALDRSPIAMTIGDNVTALTNTSITIQCPTSGVPTPTVTWTKDGQDIPDGGKYSVRGDNSLLISEADVEDDARYTCTADSVAGQDSASTEVQIVEPYKPTIGVSDESGRDIPIGDGRPVTLNVGDNLTAASNTTIIIRCPVSGVPTPSATWQKNGVEISEGNKLTILDDNTLVIKDADLEDDAKYTCTIQNAFGKDQVSSIVTIIEPSKPVIKIPGKPTMIEGQDRSPITLSIGDDVKALTNTSITIQCPTSGVPTPTITWTKDGEQVANDSRYTIQDDGSLLITEAVEEDSARYTCIAESIIGEDSASSEVQILEPVKPVIEVPKPGRDIPVGDGSPVTMNIGDNVTAASNTTITIRCPVSGVPTPAVTWEKDGVLVLNDDDRVSVREDNSLVITEAEENAEYTCKVSNVAGRDSLTSIINVIGPSKPKVNIPGKLKTIEARDRSPIIMTIGDNVTALTNTSITIQCPASGVPTPTVTWTKDGEDIPDGGKYTVRGDNSLLISEADVEDDARYTCTVDSVAGQDSASTEVQIVKPSKPTIEVSDKSARDIPIGDGSPVTMNVGDNVTAASNTTIIIRCPVSGVPAPAVTWQKDGVHIIQGDRFSITVDNSLVIQGAQVNGNAEYTCIVLSAFGKDESSSVVRIIEPSKPAIDLSETPRTIEAKDQSPITLIIGDNVTALTNTSITIQCPASGVPTPTVTWTKDGEQITDDGRYTVQDDGSLLITEAGEEDSTRYTCTVASVVGKGSASSTINIVEPIKPMIKVPEPGLEIPVSDGSPVTMNIGDNVTAASNTTITIRCPVSGVPTPSVTWQKDGARVTQGETLFISSDNSLVIKNGDVDDSAKYTCSIQSNFGKKDISSVVEIIAHRKPVVKIADEQKTIEAQDRRPVTLFIGDNVTALTNTSITIQCPTSGVPTPTVTWTKDGEQITNDGRYTVQDDGSLLIKETDEQDSDRYTCTSNSVAGKDSASSTVNIVEPIQPMIKVPEPGLEIPVSDGSPVTMNIGDNVTAASNTTITIRCPVSGVPTPSITWQKDGVPVIAGGKISFRYEKQRLVIRVAKGEDSGKYFCSVESNFGKDSLFSIVRIMGPSKPKIKILEKPKTIEAQDQSPIIMTIADNVTALTNTSITIQCTTSGVPTPTITWTKDGQDITNDGRYTVHDNGSLLISEASEEDSARYTCSADSVVGDDNASSMVQIVELIKPAIEVQKIGLKIPVGDGSPVTMNVGDNVTAASNTTITIRCPVSGVPPPSVTWHKDGVQIFEQDRITFVADNNSIVIEGAMLVDTAKYTCRVQSAFGVDEVSSQVTIIEPVGPRIASSLGDVTSFNQDQVNITIGQNLLTIIDTKLLIHCEASGVPVPKIAWIRGNETLPSDGRTSAKNGILVVVEVETSDSGNYTCIAENTAATASVSSNVTVAVPTPPEIIRTGIEDVEVLEPKSIEAVVGSTVLTINGNNVTISCGVRGFPIPSVEWTKDGVLLELEGSILSILSVDSDDTGSYTCTAKSPLGSFDSQSTNLTVIALQLPKIITNKENLEVFKIENISVPVGGVVTTLDGNRVSMVCEVSGIPAPQVTWERDGVEVQRGGKFYIIDNTSQSDNGNYSCIARNNAGEVKAISRLNVLAGSAPYVDASHGSRVDLRIDFFAITIGTNLTTLASSGLEITCPVTGFPKPSIQWYREGVPVEPGMMLNVDEFTGTLFTLSISHRKGGKFTCKGSNALGSDSASSFLTVLVPGAPQINVSRVAVRSLDSREPVSLRIGQTLSVLSGTKVSIECPVSGMPKPDVTWSRQDNNMDTDGRVLVKDSGLIITNATRTDTGVYLCKAVNLAGEVVASSIINVTKTSSPVIATADRSLQILRSGSFTVDVGSSVTTVARNALSIRCNATGVPTPQIYWNKDGRSLDTRGPLYIISSLVLSDSGRYQCTASNIDGVDNQDIRINVLDGSAPRITGPKINVVSVSGEKEVKIVVGGNITTIVGTKVEIHCPVTALPNATVTWLFNGSTVKKGNRRLLLKNLALTLSGVTPEDIGSYTCRANNSYGEATRTTLLSLIVPVEPKILPSNENVKDFESVRHELVIGDNLETLEGSTVYVRCPATGNPVPKIEWTKFGNLDPKSSSLRIVNNTLVLLNGTWSDSGTYSCTASNGAGSDEKSTYLNFMVPEKPLIRDDPVDVESYNGRPITVAVGGTLKVLKKTTVNIRCVASGIPEPSVFWNSSSNDMQPANKFDVKQEGRVLTIHDVGTRDSGNYTCSAVNKAGEDTSAAVLEVVEATLPTIVSSDATLSWYNRESRTLPVGGTVEVLSGTQVTLTCRYSAFPEPDVEWSVLDEEGDPLPNAGYEIVNGSLVLMALQPSDSAQYVCSVTNVAGTTSASTTLQVVDPGPPLISSSQDNIVSLSDRTPVEVWAGSVVTVLSGTRITITCSAIGTPTPSVAWSRGEELIHTPSAGNMRAAHTGILTIEDASTNDTGDYLCTAMSEVGVDQESTKITVIEPSKPIIRQPEVEKIPLTNDTLVQVSVGSDVTVLTQTRVNVTCEVSGVPKSTITWLKDGKRVESEESSYLVLNIRNVEDAGQVTCHARNLAGNASLSTNINVIEPLVPRITSDTGTIDALDKRQAVSSSVGMTVQTFTGTSVTLKCQTEGSPKPVVSWSKNGQPLESKGRVSISGDGTLTVRSTRAQDTGRYKCSAKNAIGETSKASSVYIRSPMSPKIRKSKAYIIWYEKQPFKGKIGDNLTTLKGRKLTLTCPAVGLPKPAIAWYRSGMRMKSGKNYLVIGQTLIMYNLDPMDTDRYTCVARNFAGVKTATTTLKVHEPMAPDIMPKYGSEESLQDRRHFNVTIGKDISILRGSPLTLKCPVVGVPEPKITWIKDRKMLSSNDRMSTDCIGTLDIHKVELEDSGDYACSAQNFLGMDIAFSSVTVYEAVKPTVEISGRAYVSAGDLVDMHVGDNLTAILTTPVKINCTAKGIPKPKMTWKMNGQQLGNGGNYKTDNRGALAIKGVKDPGEFTCIAENFVGQDDASSFISLLDPARPVVINPEKTTAIEAKDRSPISLSIGDNLTALTNTSITIQCPTSGVPTPTVTWTKDGDEILNAGRYTIQDDGALLINEALEEDSARYACIADSVIGKDSASSMVKIVEPIKPVIEVREPGQKIPVGDGSPVTMNIGDNVTAASNTTIAIRCPVSGVPEPDVTWERDGEQVTPGGRFSISSDSTLVIKEAAVDDSTEYTCSVKSVAGTDSKSSTVEIIKPSKPVVKLPDTPKTREAKDRSPITMTIADNVTALTNTSITIQCPASGVPTPTVAWTKDGQEITNDGRYRIQDDGSLLISEALEEDSARYTCTARNAAGKNSASSMVKIAGLEKPSILVQKPGPKVPIGYSSPVVTPVGSQITEIASVRISLTCPTEGSPPPKINWKKDGKELASGDRYYIDDEGTLTILQAVLKDTGNFTCSAQNEAGVEEVTSSIDILEPLEPIILPPQDSIVSDDFKRVTAGVGSKIDALKGATITITCEVKGVPKPNVSWTRDGQSISPDERVVLGSNGTLIIRDSSLEDSGNYTCTATSRAGQSSSTSPLAVSVASKPSIERSEEEVSWGKESHLTVAVGSRVEIINGSSVTLVCNSSGFPPPKLTWTRGIEILPSDSNHEISEQSLTIRDIQFADADEYTCSATNQAGQDAATTELVVKGPGRPVILSHKINITDVDSSKPVVVPIGANVTTIVNATIVITCPSKGSPQPIVTWKHDQRFIVAGRRYQVNDTTLIIREVRLDDAGRYDCTASNSFGRDVQSLSLDVTVPPLISNVKGSFEITDIRDLVSITTGAVVTIPRGVAVRIKCIATGIPSPNITWYRKGENTKEKSLLVPNENMKIMKDYSLHISHTLVVDAAYYTCVATNIAGQDEGTTHLNIGTPPEIPSYWRGVTSRFSDQVRDSRKSSGAVATVVKGATLNIKCAVVGNPKPTIKWIVHTASRQRRYTVLNDGTLEVPNADLEDEGNYTCIAKNSFGTLNRTTSVSILVPPEILERHFRHLYDEKRVKGYAMAQMEVKRRTISSLTIEEGYNLILICTVSGKPKPRVTWSRNKVVIKNDTRHLLLPNGVLLVRHVLVKESGQYKCVATNPAGEDQGIVQLTVKDQAKGYWKVTDWSKCKNCVMHLRGWQERDISCIGPGGYAVSDLHCIHKPKPIKRQRCIHRDCHVIWSTSVWSACSGSCGLHGIKLRNVKCVFAKSLKPAKGQCSRQEKPTTQEPCNRKSCTRANCLDRVKYCDKVKKIGMCTVYSRWCCNTCHTA